MADKAGQIGEIVQFMLNTWDFPADCNEGELFTYAETLYDRIVAGDGKDALYTYLSEVQVEHLEMPRSDAFKAIVDRAVELSRAQT
jgi:hypothetical protein